MIWKLSFIVVFAYSIGYSQISSVNIVETSKTATYDSTENFLGNNPQLYKGTDLYLPGKSQSLQKYGYDDFKDSPNFGVRYIGEDVYKCCSDQADYYSSYSLLAGSTFKVIDVKKTDDVWYAWYLILQHKGDQSIAYFNYSPEAESSFPFIDMRVFNKIKQKTLNKCYIVKQDSFNDYDTIKSIDGEIIDSIWSFVWKCIDVVIEERYYSLSLLLENCNQKRIVFNVDRLNKEEYIIPADMAEIYKVGFGLFWYKVIQNLVTIGMSERMVRVAWGSPVSTNKTITKGSVTEQWVYNGSYVYFNNGIVNAIQ